jgi:hypothetical protein
MTFTFTIEEQALAAIAITGFICLATAEINRAICQTVEWVSRERLTRRDRSDSF